MRTASVTRQRRLRAAVTDRAHIIIIMFHTNYDETTRTWYGQPTAPLFHPDVSVAQVLLGALRRRPHHLGQVSDSSGVRLSNRMLRLNAIRAAEHLALLGVGEGDVLALVAKNHHHVAAVVVAAMALAAPVNTLDPHFTCGMYYDFVL